MKEERPRPLALIILDGWGHRKEQEANAIAAAKKPFWDHLLSTYTHTLIAGSGRSVGLPDNQMGNSEVGHLNMGAGRIVHQDLTRIDQAIESGDFFKNSILVSALEEAKKTGKAIHLMGLVSPGGVHSHENHLFALIKLAAEINVPALYIHAFLDGRDTPPKSAQASLDRLTNLCTSLHCGEVVSLIGRYYAMDRDKRWERIEKAYNLLALGQADFHATTPQLALEAAYARGETDEFVQATAIYSPSKKPVAILDGDTIIFINFRSDRAREITEAFIDPNFKGFDRITHPDLGAYICLAEYDERFKTPIAFPPQTLTNTLSEYVSHLGLKQLRIAETEKYAHVTFFFNGGIEKPYPHEDRLLIPSPKVATYDLQPEMSAPDMTKRLVEEIKKQKYDLIICNFANADMVGHTGNLAATIKAIETIDTCLSLIINALLEVGGEALITADHGNAEQMFDYTHNQPHTSHTSELVPFIYVGRNSKINKSDGKLSDISPTLLYLLGIPKPAEMTGESLLKLV